MPQARAIWTQTGLAVQMCGQFWWLPSSDEVQSGRIENAPMSPVSFSAVNAGECGAIMKPGCGGTYGSVVAPWSCGAALEKK